MTDAYGNVRKSKLAFKGSAPLKKANKVHQGSIATNTIKKNLIPSTGGSCLVSTESENVDIEREQLVKLKGSGRITTSQITVYGHETKFQSELSVGDAIIVQHPKTFQEETKIVKIVLSDTSLAISSSFSYDLVSTTAFEYVKASRSTYNQSVAVSSSDHNSDERMQKLKVDSEVAAFGTYASQGGTKFAYRVKKAGAAGSYAIVTEDLKDCNKSREDLLAMRCKKKSDRHCG
jgi:hypothetical protein